MKSIDELEWEGDEIEFWFGHNEICDTREKRCNLKRAEKANSLGLGSNTYNIERQLRKDMKDWKWKEPRKEKKKFKWIDLISGYEEKVQWRIRLIIHSNGELGYSF